MNIHVTPFEKQTHFKLAPPPSKPPIYHFDVYTCAHIFWLWGDSPRRQLASTANRLTPAVQLLSSPLIIPTRSWAYRAFTLYVFLDAVRKDVLPQYSTKICRHGVFLTSPTPLTPMSHVLSFWQDVPVDWTSTGRPEYFCCRSCRDT